MERLTLTLLMVLCLGCGAIYLEMRDVASSVAAKPAEVRIMDEPQERVTKWTSALGQEEVRTPRHQGEETDAWNTRHRNAVISAQLLDPPV